MALTTAMIVSSFLGYVALGCSVSAFIPLVVTNAVRRVSGTGLYFVVCWLAGDICNLIGVFLLGAQLTQVMLAGWYLSIDLVMLVQVILFGHTDRGVQNPKPAKALVKRKQRTKWWKRFSEAFESFSKWDSTKTALICIGAALTWWGIFIVYNVQLNPDYEIDIPTEISTVSRILGFAGSLIFAIARVPEFVSGWRRSGRQEKPLQELDDAMFYLLTLTPVNLWNAELPWIVGGAVPIMCDIGLIVSIFIWHSRWKTSPLKAATEAEDNRREEVLEKLRSEELELKEEWLAEDIRREAQTAPDTSLKSRKAKKDQKNRKSLLDDYNKHQPALQPIHDRASQRARTQARLDRHLQRHPDSASSASERDSERDRPNSSRREEHAPSRSASQRTTSYHPVHTTHVAHDGGEEHAPSRSASQRSTHSRAEPTPRPSISSSRQSYYTAA